MEPIPVVVFFLKPTKENSSRNKDIRFAEQREAAVFLTNNLRKSSAVRWQLGTQSSHNDIERRGMNFAFANIGDCGKYVLHDLSFEIEAASDSASQWVVVQYDSI